MEAWFLHNSVIHVDIAQKTASPWLNGCRNITVNEEKRNYNKENKKSRTHGTSSATFGPSCELSFVHRLRFNASNIPLQITESGSFMLTKRCVQRHGRENGKKLIIFVFRNFTRPYKDDVSMCS